MTPNGQQWPQQRGNFTLTVVTEFDGAHRNLSTWEANSGDQVLNDSLESIIWSQLGLREILFQKNKAPKPPQKYPSPTLTWSNCFYWGFVWKMQPKWKCGRRARDRILWRIVTSLHGPTFISPADLWSWSVCLVVGFSTWILLHLSNSSTDLKRGNSPWCYHQCAACSLEWHFASRASLLSEGPLPRVLHGPEIMFSQRFVMVWGDTSWNRFLSSELGWGARGAPLWLEWDTEF